MGYFLVIIALEAFLFPGFLLSSGLNALSSVVDALVT